MKDITKLRFVSRDSEARSAQTTTVVDNYSDCRRIEIPPI